MLRSNYIYVQCECIGECISELTEAAYLALPVCLGVCSDPFDLGGRGAHEALFSFLNTGAPEALDISISSVL